MRFFYLLAALLCVTVPARALELAGALEQGGIALGEALPGSTVTLGERAVSVAPDGGFVLGFDRNAPATMVLTVTGPDGTRQTHDLPIAKRDWQVERVDGLPPKTVTPDPQTAARIGRENALITATRQSSSPVPHYRSGFMIPAQGRKSGVFGSQRILNGQPRSPHSGTDWAAPRGTPVLAAADGTVSLVHPDMVLTGKTVMVDHGGGLQSVYIHMDSIAVQAGQTVHRGDPIGTVGTTGRSTGPHLHFGITWQGVKLDPETVLTQLPPERFETERFNAN